MFEVNSELFRGVVVNSNKLTGEVLVNLPSVLGLHGSIPVDIINNVRYDGLYEVPDPGTQVIVGTEDRDFTHAFLIQVDPGTVRKSPNWNGQLVNGIITEPGTQGWVIDGIGNVEFNNGAFRGNLLSGTIDIGGMDETSFHVDEEGRMFMGGGTWEAATFKIDALGNVIGTGDFAIPGLSVTDGDAVFTGALSGGSIDIGTFEVATNGDLTHVGNVTLTGVIRISNGTFAAHEMRLGTDLSQNYMLHRRLDLDGVSLDGWQRAILQSLYAAAYVELQPDGNFVLNDNGQSWGMKSIGSSLDVKQDIITLETGALAKVRRIRPVSFKRKYNDRRPEIKKQLEDLRRNRGGNHIAEQVEDLEQDLAAAEERWRTRLDPAVQQPELGFVAEELAAIEPRLVVTSEDGAPTGIMYQQVSALLVKALQEMDARVAAIEARLPPAPTPPNPPGGNTP